MFGYLGFYSLLCKSKPKLGIMIEDYKTNLPDENETQHQVQEDVAEVAYGLQNSSLLHVQRHAVSGHAETAWGHHASAFVTAKMNRLVSAWKAAGYFPSIEDVQTAIAVFEGEEDEANGRVLSEEEMDDFFERFAV